MADRSFRHQAALIVLTALCGAGLAAFFQYGIEKSKRGAELREARRTAAIAVLESVGHLGKLCET